MKEVIERRYSRLTKENKPMPDLLIVDGGAAQIHAAMAIRDELGADLTIAGLVKDDKHTTRALLNENLEEIELDKTHPLFFMLTRMQDEVHRFAITYHKHLRAKGMTKSILDDIPGIGPARKKQIQSAFPSMKKMKAATQADFEAIVPEKVAQLLYRRLHEDDLQPLMDENQFSSEAVSEFEDDDDFVQEEGQNDE